MYRRARHLVHLYFQNQYRKHKLGAYGKVVEVDESKFTHNTKGGVRNRVWVIGFYERGSKDVRAYVLHDKSESSILALMRENIIEGADVVTDSWRGYAECKSYFNHRVCSRMKTSECPEKPSSFPPPPPL